LIFYFASPLYRDLGSGVFALLGWDHIICVFNKTTGNVDNLPFDIRPRRVKAYELVQDQDKSEQRKALVSALRDEIKSILHAPDLVAQAALQQLISGLAGVIIPVILYGSELEERAAHIPIFEKAVERFRAGDYLSCTGLVFPRIEGVMRSQHLASGANNKRCPRASGFLPDPPEQAVGLLADILHGEVHQNPPGSFSPAAR